MAARNV